jgi:hypothetical protein
MILPSTFFGALGSLNYGFLDMDFLCSHSCETFLVSFSHTLPLKTYTGVTIDFSPIHPVVSYAVFGSRFLGQICGVRVSIYLTRLEDLGGLGRPIAV